MVLVLAAVMVTGLEVVTAPASSVALAVIECVPEWALVQTSGKGGVVACPKRAPSAKYSTFNTAPSRSPAEACNTIFVGSVKVEPLVGVRMATEGGLFETVNDTGAESVTPRRLSVARAARVCDPAGVLLQAISKGNALARPMFSPSAKNSTWRTNPSGS